ITPAEGVIDHFQTATLETADLPEGHFDLSYSFMVVEHVADPDAFLAAVQRSLRPGGVHFFVTVNGHHYFAKLAKFMKTMKVEDAMLRVLRGKQTTDSYHYPVQYRMNRPEQISRLAASHGFEEPEYVFIEEDGPKPYLRGPLKPFWSAMMAKRRKIQNPRQLLTMYCRMRKQV
ncbi:MAG: class I SAM-dependent methyltransferase, partial [Phycisphaerales bacterium]